MTETIEKNTPRGLSGFALHLIAMALMLLDHLWATVIPGQAWMTWIGRLAFPIFAFLIAEGWYRTSDRKKYLQRMVIFALLAEIPFNLMTFASPIFPFHQNVLWTFALALLCMNVLEKQKARENRMLAVVLSLAQIAAFCLLASILMTDYGGNGVLTVLVFYFFRGEGLWMRLAQVVWMYLINFAFIRGLVLPVSLFGLSFELPQQGMAILALPILWLYQGRQGAHSKPIQYAYYAFYPVHMLILGLLSMR